LTPLKEDKNLIDPKQIPIIFCNVENLCAISKKLLDELEKKLANWDETSTIADAFIQQVESPLLTKVTFFQLPYFNAYIDYLKNHHHAISAVNTLKEKKSFSAWMQVCKLLSSHSIVGCKRSQRVRRIRFIGISHHASPSIFYSFFRSYVARGYCDISFYSRLPKLFLKLIGEGFGTKHSKRAQGSPNNSRCAS
jgi:hypothetical protein